MGQRAGMSLERVGLEGKPRSPRLGCGHESREEADVLVARTHRPRDASRGRGSTSGCSTSPNNQNLAKPHGQANRQLASLRSHAGPARSRNRGQPQLPLTLLSGSVGVGDEKKRVEKAASRLGQCPVTWKPSWGWQPLPPRPTWRARLTPAEGLLLRGKSSWPRSGRIFRGS